jgi:hypothetical protein
MDCESSGINIDGTLESKVYRNEVLRNYGCGIEISNSTLKQEMTNNKIQGNRKVGLLVQ